MTTIDATPGHFCWVDLAVASVPTARVFYEQLFGWSAEPQPVGRGVFHRFLLDGADVGSLYQLRRRHLASGVPAHWTPYVAVASADRSARKAAALGASVIVEPFDVAGIARIALLRDPQGAMLGLWQSLGEPAAPEDDS